jgi:Putative bacterial sensory transduction regulator
LTNAFSPDQLDGLEALISQWLATELIENPVMLAVDRGEPGERRWYVRLAGEEKDFTTVWLTLAQRHLYYETYVMPAPEENEGALYEQLLRRNRALVGAHFAIGDENAIYLVGQLPLKLVVEEELDRIIGSLYAAVEQCFKALLRVGFASRFPA